MVWEGLLEAGQAEVGWEALLYVSPFVCSFYSGLGKGGKLS